MSNEHVDNYLAEIERLKVQLNTLNTAIAKAEEDKKAIEEGNHALLQARTEILERKIKEADDLRHDANHLHAKNSLLSDQLDKSHDEHNKNVQEFNDAKDNHAVFVKNKSNELDIREIALDNFSVNLNLQMKDIEEKIKVHEALKEQLMDQAKANEALLVQIKEQQDVIDQAIAVRAKMIEDLQALNEQVEAGKQATHKDLLNAQKCLAEAQSKEEAALHALEVVSAKEEGLKDLILQSKKEQMDASKMSERATKNLTEANLKIAELKELREAMAQQEK